MSEFACPVVRVSIEPHPQADQIEIARVGDYQSIVRKGQFQDGDLAVYIPEQSVIPEWLLKEMNLWDAEKGCGVLAGSKGDRVRAIRLRGVVSQGLLYPVEHCNSLHAHSYSVKVPDRVASECLVMESVGEPVELSQELPEPIGFDASGVLGVTKYEPPAPSHMRGRVVGVDYAATHKYDFENLKKFPSLFTDGEPVVICEKIHGTNMCIGVVPSSEANERYYAGRVTISSKGMGAKGMVLDHNDETNLYAQAAAKHNLLNKVLNCLGQIADDHEKSVFLIGEVFGLTRSGAGIQDLTYTGGELEFMAFDIAIGNRGSEKYAGWFYFEWLCEDMGIDTVPLLYVGGYSKDIVLKHTDGETTLPSPNKKAHMREGVVVKSYYEEQHPTYGRKIAKSISDAYLLRKGGTELN